MICLEYDFVAGLHVFYSEQVPDLHVAHQDLDAAHDEVSARIYELDDDGDR